jgi:hypothetical protein
MGPFNMPWLTFAAILVVAASIAVAILWALHDRKRNPDKDR